MNEKFAKRNSKITAKPVGIRRAKITDAIPFLKLEAVCFEMKFSEASLYYWRPIIEYCYAFKAVFSNKIIGGVIAIPTRNGQIYISSLFVHTKFRKLGVATKLLDRTLMIDSKNGYVLDVKPEKRHLISFYTKHGFRAIRTKQNYYLDGTSRILMTRLYNSSNEL